MSYVDTMVAAVPSAQKAAYLEMARGLATIFLDCGALEVTDCWGSDVPEGKLTSFPLAVRQGEGETVATGWIVWPSKSVRDAGWDEALSDPRMPRPDAMPFDGRRMIFAGFDMINRARREG